MLRITDNYTLQTLCGAPHNICNEEGKLLGMEGNKKRFAEIEDISPQEVQAATGFFFCAM